MNKKKIVSIMMSTFLVSNLASNIIVNANTEVNENEVVQKSTGLVIELGNTVISEGEGGDLTENLDNVKGLEEGTFIIRFTESGEGIQSLFSISNNTRGNEHFHVYVNEGQVGYELRKDSGNVSTGKVDASLNPGINTVAFKAVSDGGYSIFVNGEKVLDVEDDDAAFLTHLEEANKFSVGITERTGNEYPLTGKVDFFEVYNAPLSDDYLLDITGQTVTSDLPIPEGTFKSDPVDIFAPGDLGSQNFRIPALYTTQAGTVLASIDVRRNGGHDAPNNNIDVGIVRSEDNGVTWTDQEVILDYPGKSAAIDTAMVQDPETGRIFLMVTHFSEGYGFGNSLTGSGYEEIQLVDENGDGIVDEDGNPVTERYLIVTNAAGEQYTVRDGVIYTPEGEPTTYTVDEDKNLYNDGTLDGHILTGEGDFKMYGTTFISLIHSDDDGRTWSDPIDLNYQAKEDWMRFFGTGPGVGHVIQNGEYAGRILFPIYITNAIGFQSSACLYSDDNGETWNYDESATDGRIKSDGTPASAETMTGSMGLEQLTECQVVEMPNGQIKMFMRNTTSTVKVATSFDGGATWDNVIESEEELPEPYCQLTVMNYSQQIDGKDAIIFANPATGGRTGGTVRIGLINEVGTYDNGEPRYEFDWAYSQLVKEGVYQYSCLTELPDGNIGLFYEGTSNQEMSFTAMDVGYIKADLDAEIENAPAATITSIESYDNYLSYGAGDTVNLKVTFNEAVSLIGDRNLVLDINGEEVPVTIETLSATEYKLTGIIPENMANGEYAITVKAKEGLEVINSFNKLTDLASDIVTESNIVITDESVLNPKVFEYTDLTIVNGEGGDISGVVDNVKDLEEGTIIIEFDNNGGEKFQTLLSFSNSNENRERFYVFVNDNDEIGIERQSSSGNKVVKQEGLTLNDGINKIAVKVEAGVGYSIFVNGVKVITEADVNAKFIDGIVDLNSVDIGRSDRLEDQETPFTGEVYLAQLYRDIKSDEELIELTSEDEVVVDKTGLQTVVDSVGILESSDYTAETWEAVTNAVTAANVVLGNAEATQEEVDSAKDTLQTAINALVEAPGIYGGIGLTVEETINKGDTTNLKIAINDMKEDYSAYTAEITLGYDDSIFDLGDITSLNESYIVTAGEAVDGVVEILVASLGTPIVSAEDIINVELTSKGAAEASPLVVSGAIADGDTIKDLTENTARVRVNEELHTFKLEIAVDEAEKITEEELEHVIPFVLELFHESLEEAKALLADVEAGEFTTQSQLDAAFDKLADALHRLEHKGDRTELEALIENLNTLVEEHYTSTTWANLQEVLNSEEVQEVLNNENALNEQIEVAYDKLFEAFTALVLRAEEEAVEKLEEELKRIEALIIEVELVDPDRYIPSTWEELKNVYDQANAVFENPDATQEEVLEAYDELIRAYLSLRLTPDKSALEELLGQAEGLNAEDYTVESFNNLQVVVKTAQDVFNNPESSKNQVEEEEKKLERALLELVAVEDEEPEVENPEEDKEPETGDEDKNPEEDKDPETGDEDKNPEEDEEPEIEVENNEEKEDDSSNQEKLPQTGGTSSIAVGLLGTIMATAGAFISRKKKK